MKFLSYESRFIQALRLLFDYIGLNLMFLLFSAPIITIGSARVAFYTAIRAMQRNEPWAALFWKTFITSLKEPTIVWCICLPLVIVFALNGRNYFALQQNLIGVVSYICMGITMCVASLSPMFFSRFDCTVKEMVFNSLKMLLAFPIRVALGTALAWVPVAVYVIRTLNWILLSGVLIFGLVYFSLAGALFSRMMRNPFGRLSGDVMEEEDSYLVKEAKKNLEKFERDFLQMEDDEEEKQEQTEETDEATEE